MPIQIGTSTKNQQALPIDDKSIGKVYVGDKLVWSKPSIITPIKYGALYNFYALSKNGGTGVGSIAPEGYHVPTWAEIQTLSATVGGTSGALRETGNSYWISPSEETATNAYGFNGRGSGYRDNYGSFSGLNEYGYIATCEVDSSFNGGNPNYDLVRVGYLTYYNSNIVNSFLSIYKKRGLSTVCLKNISDWEQGETVTDQDGNIYSTVKIGNQVWMVGYLMVTHYNDGTPIPNVTDNSEWAANTVGAYCWYDNDINNK